MIIDVNLHDGRMHRMILPGGTLAYGHQDTLSKGVALVWAIWLVAGPKADDVQRVCDLVSCLTTDGGVELHLLEILESLRGGDGSLDRRPPLFKLDHSYERTPVFLAKPCVWQGGPTRRET